MYRRWKIEDSADKHIHNKPMACYLYNLISHGEGEENPKARSSDASLLRQLCTCKLRLGCREAAMPYVQVQLRSRPHDLPKTADPCAARHVAPVPHAGFEHRPVS